MDLAPRSMPLQLPRVRADWPLAPAKPYAADRDIEVARQFETIIAETLLRTARAASLGDDGFGTSDLPGGDNVRAMVDHARAEAIARAAPMGVARLLAAEAQPRQAPR
jgi:Rod binding domain-containing protein